MTSHVFGRVENEGDRTCSPWSGSLHVYAQWLANTCSMIEAMLPPCPIMFVYVKSAQSSKTRRICFLPSQGQISDLLMIKINSMDLRSKLYEDNSINSKRQKMALK